ncbi:lmo0937 family membrane protein [Halalkalibacter hemicellulosilyticus]|nr:lmo0937 family membrane protein [Halalkalibacter hemicellulosilyticus]
MLWTIFLVLLILWILGMVSGTILNGFIHILLVIAVVTLLIRIIRGKSPV